jgi:hypothetical protein
MMTLLPTLAHAAPHSSPGLVPKLGGLPWGLPATLWPVCRECGQPMSPVAQLPVADTLDRLGPLQGRAECAELVLHLFKCEGDDICSFWEPDIGTNAAFFVPRAALGDGETPAPTGTPEMLPDIRVQDWVAYDDPVPPELADAVSHPTRWLNELTDDMQFPRLTRTKLGGAPWWTGNGPQQVPDAPFQYLLQIDQFLEMPGDEDDVTFGNFCSDGTLYVFIDPTTPIPRAMMFINR